MARKIYTNPLKALGNMLSLGKGGGLSIFKKGLESIFLPQMSWFKGVDLKERSKPLLDKSLGRGKLAPGKRIKGATIEQLQKLFKNKPPKFESMSDEFLTKLMNLSSRARLRRPTRQRSKSTAGIFR